MRLLQGPLVIFGSQADIAISVFREVRFNIVLLWISIPLSWDVPNLSPQNNASNAVSCRLSVNSSNHPRRSRKRSSESRMSSIFFLFLLWLSWEIEMFHCRTHPQESRASSAQLQTSQTNEFQPGRGRMQYRLHRWPSSLQSISSAQMFFVSSSPSNSPVNSRTLPLPSSTGELVFLHSTQVISDHRMLPTLVLGR